MTDNEIQYRPEEIQTFEIEAGVIAVFVGCHQEAAKKAQILRAAPKLLNLAFEMLSAEHEERQAIYKKVRIRHEATDLLKELGCNV